jgi:hypothetical protein
LISSQHLLPRHPAPRRTESLMGYILRLSEENGYSTPFKMLPRAGIRRISPYKFTDISKLTQSSPAFIRSIGYHLGAKKHGHYCLLWHAVRSRDLLFSRAKLCPECVEEKGFIEAYFDLAVMIACPVHKRMLVDVCSNCHQNLQWSRPGLLECSCGASLSLRSVRFMDKAATDLLDVIRRKVLRLPSALEYESRIPAEQFSRMNLRSILSMIEALGRVESKPIGTVTLEHWEHLVLFAASICSDWPNNFERLLEKLASEKTTDTLHRSETNNLERLHNSLLNRDAAFVRDAVSSFVINSLVDDEANRKEESFSRCSERFVTCKKLFSRCKVDRQTGFGILQAQNIPIVQAKWLRKTESYIDIASACAFQKTIRNLYKVKKVAALTGLSVMMLRRLKDSGDFEVRHLPKEMSRMHERDVQSFIAKAEDLIPHLARNQKFSQPVIRLSSISRLSDEKIAARANIFRLVLAKKIPVVGRAGKKIGDLLIRKDLFLQNLHVELGYV